MNGNKQHSVCNKRNLKLKNTGIKLKIEKKSVTKELITNGFLLLSLDYTRMDQDFENKTW